MRCTLVPAARRDSSSASNGMVENIGCACHWRRNASTPTRPASAASSSSRRTRRAAGLVVGDAGRGAHQNEAAHDSGGVERTSQTQATTHGVTAVDGGPAAVDQGTRRGGEVEAVGNVGCDDLDLRIVEVLEESAAHRVPHRRGLREAVDQARGAWRQAAMTYDVNTAFARCLVDEWRRAGLSDAVVSPGSRSTPLALALADDDRFKVHVHIDERSAAFFALGLAKVTGRPAILLCTSGTAAANFHPAVLEASYAPGPDDRVHGRPAPRAARRGRGSDGGPGPPVRGRGPLVLRGRDSDPGSGRARAVGHVAITGGPGRGRGARSSGGTRPSQPSLS